MNVDPAVFGEFVGTALLIVLGDGVVAAVSLSKSKAEGAGWLTITVGWGLAVFAAVAVSISMGDTDAHLNPAFTVASVLMTGHPERLFTYIPAQILGGLIGAVLVWLFFLPHWKLTPDPGAKLGCFSTIPAVRSYGSNFFCEVLATFVLVLVASALVSRRLAPGGVAPGLGPVLVGALVWSVGISLGATTGYAINPARDLGPRIAHSLLPIAGKGTSDWRYAWIPIFGPIVGAILSAILVRTTGM